VVVIRLLLVFFRCVFPHFPLPLRLCVLIEILTLRLLSPSFELMRCVVPGQFWKLVCVEFVDCLCIGFDRWSSVYPHLLCFRVPRFLWGGGPESPVPFHLSDGLNLRCLCCCRRCESSPPSDCDVGEEGHE
jgi:hypothetical protein